MDAAVTPAFEGCQWFVENRKFSSLSLLYKRSGGLYQTEISDNCGRIRRQGAGISLL